MLTFQGARSAPLILVACTLAALPCAAGIAAAASETAETRSASPKAPYAVARQSEESLSLPELRARLDESDRVAALHALNMALNRTADGATFIWQKNNRNLKGVIKPTSAFRNAHGQVCRHVIYAISLGRYRKQIELVACREAGGRWRL